MKMPVFLDRMIRNVLNRWGLVLMKSNRAAMESLLVPLNTVSAGRFLHYRSLVERTCGVEGDIVECGVAAGQSLLMMAILVKLNLDKRNLWGFDSFEGFPEPADADVSPRNARKGQLKFNMKNVYRNLNDYIGDTHFTQNRVTLVKGFFEDTLDKYPHERMSLLNLDVDLYKSYKVCLETFYPKLSVGGVVAFDEFLRESDAWPGALKAIEEFFADKDVTFDRCPYYGKYYVVKKQP